MLAESIPLHAAQEKFEDEIIFDIARTVFGITPEAIAGDDVFVKAVFFAICERFPGITTNDIGEAFLTHEPREKVYVLSRKDFIEPIQRYWSKKMVVVMELTAAIEEAESEAKVGEYAAKFRQECLQLYRECLAGDRKWTGTEVQANTFAGEAFGHLFEQSEKDAIWIESKREWMQRREAVMNSDNPFAMPPPPAEKIFSRRIVEAALAKGLTLEIKYP